MFGGRLFLLADEAFALVVVVLHPELVEINGEEAQQAFVAAESQLEIVHEFAVGRLELDAVIHTGRTALDLVRKRTQPHLVNVNNMTTYLLEVVDICLSCRFNFIARQHWVHDESNFVVFH